MRKPIYPSSALPLVPASVLPLVGTKLIEIQGGEGLNRTLSFAEAAKAELTPDARRQVAEALCKLLGKHGQWVSKGLSRVSVRRCDDPLLFHRMNLDPATSRALASAGLVEHVRHGAANLGMLVGIPGLGAKSMIAVILHLESMGHVRVRGRKRDRPDNSRALAASPHPLLTELRSIVTLRAGSERNADVYMALTGLETGTPIGTRLVGAQFGISHENANMIRARVDEGSQLHTIDLRPFPEIARLRAALMERKAGRVRDLAAAFNVNADVLRRALDFMAVHVGLPGLTKTAQWGDEVVFLVLDDMVDVYDLVRAALEQLARGNYCSTFAKVLAQVHRISPDSIDPLLVRLALDCLPDLQWLDDDKEAFFVGQTPVNRLTTAVDKVLEAFGTVDSTTLAEGLRRDENLVEIANAPRLEVILTRLGYRVRVGRVRPRTGTAGSKLKPSESKMLKILKQAGGSLPLEEFAKRCANRKIAGKTFYPTFQRSPVFREGADGCLPLVT